MQKVRQGCAVCRGRDDRERFLKAFMRLNTYKGQGSFEAWIRQIMVHEALNFLRKNKSLEFETTIPDKENYKKSGVSIQTDTGYLLKLINDLPFSYRFVFMLHAIEGYKHTEIAKLLRISENTSKSKLSKARKILRQKLELQRKRYEAL